ncbi:MAG TPA: CCA tRNA nucleotidyltransferase [Bacillales bacterium]|nr:CCA tRNA nucleotidyltransferase [Bacillales bacterium]
MADIFRDAAEVVGQLKQNGYEAFIVGGAVRDSLLGRRVDDVDIASSATPQQVVQLFRKTIPVGVEHGTVVVRHRGRSFEVTTFRTESDYIDHRRPSAVSFVSSLHEDLQRRDFTINAMAMTESGEIIDPYGGRDDLTNKVIRTVGKASERFKEDPLRMMRAVRFASQLDFRIEAETLSAMTRAAADLTHISVERKTAEFEKLMAGTAPGRAFRQLVTSGLFRYLPGLTPYQQGLVHIDADGFLPLHKNAERWAYFVRSMAISDETDWLKRWKLANRLVQEIKRLTDVVRTLGHQAWTPWLVYQTGVDTAVSAERVRAALHERTADTERIYEIARQLPIHERKQLAVDGRDLLGWWDRPPGPWISHCLEQIEREVIGGRLENRKEALKGWLLKQKS